MYDGDGKITELSMKPDYGETLTLTGDTLSFAAGAQIVGAPSSATACGTYVSIYGNRVHMGYGGCSHGTGYVNLGTENLGSHPLENLGSHPLGK